MVSDYRPTLIGIYSPVAGSGKTTVANYLTTEHRFSCLSFAEPLKAMVWTLYDYLNVGPRRSHHLLTHGKEDPVPEIDDRITTRHVLRTLGSEWGRDCIHPQLWLKAWEARYFTMPIAKDGRRRVVVDDVRFENEANLVRSLGGEMWHLSRPSAPAHHTPHASEGGLDAYPYFDRHIVNNGTLAELELTIDRIFRPA